MNYYAHTAKHPDGRSNPDERTWQFLSGHLRNVSALAKRFAAPLNLAREAELSGLLHDLGKYAERFQARLRDPSIHGINHWAADRSGLLAICSPARQQSLLETSPSTSSYLESDFAKKIRAFKFVIVTQLKSLVIDATESSRKPVRASRGEVELINL